MRTLRSRFILTHILPTLLIVPLASILLLYLIETQYLLDNLRVTLETQAAQFALQTVPTSDIDANTSQRFFLVQVSQATSSNLYLIDCQLDTPDDREASLCLGNLPDNGISIEFQGLISSREIDLDPQFAEHVDQILEAAAEQVILLRRLFLSGLLLQLLCGILIGAYLAGRTARPITEATTAVTEIAQHERVEPIPEKGAREIRSLAHSVNQLSAELQHLEETRRHLLANLVHELGRPLGAMLAAVHVLRDGADEDQELRQELLQGIEEHIQIMQPLLEDLAQLGGQVLGTRELNLQPTALSEWLPPLLLPWRASAQAKGLQWQAEVAANLPTLAIDADRLAQAIGNLLSNAVKYTPAGGLVNFTAVAQNNHVLLTVSDSGPGIAAAEQANIFDPFYRSSRQTRFPQGMGLGLTIARDLVEAHHGSLTLTSHEGEGSQFIIKLPFTSDV